jgi:protein-tyrosine phosphatase
MASACIRSTVSMIDVMRHYLTNDLQATDEEIAYLKTLCALKSKPRDTPGKRQGPQKPSMIIEGFLYHGSLGHARNMDLLKELQIQHILNVCETPLEKDIAEQFNILWINIDDEPDADICQHFDTTNSFLQACEQKGAKVLVHCQMGISRSSSIVLAYLLK